MTQDCFVLMTRAARDRFGPRDAPLELMRGRPEWRVNSRQIDDARLIACKLPSGVLSIGRARSTRLIISP